MLLKFAIILNNISIFIRNKLRKNYIKNFIKKYNLKEGFFIPKVDRRYNPYEGTNLIILQKLIDKGVINKDDNIMDIGCGVGILLFYLIDKGFFNVYGIEMNEDLYNILLENLKEYKRNGKYGVVPNVKFGNAITEPIPDKINCFYFYNPFFDERTYKDWLRQLQKSLTNNKRKIKIILLYPTLAALDAFKSCSWLKRKMDLICKEQVCYICIRFVIFENM